MCLNFEIPKISNFPFGNGKLIILGVPKFGTNKQEGLKALNRSPE